MDDDQEHVVLVDELGRAVGRMDKLAAHRAPGAWHAAFSVMVRDRQGHLLLHRRAPGKYHFPGAWTNSCCSHPRSGEDLADAVVRRVRDELGLDVATRPLRHAGSFWYRADDAATGMVEREHDQVVIVDDVDHDDVHPDPDEMDAVQWVTADQARALVASGPVTPWFSQVLDLVLARPQD